MNLGDPELEVIDPTPDVYSLFVHFDKIFFGAKLASRAVVRWSKRMYSCAGVCSYEGRGGLCDVALSEPLLKLRPRKDLVETLLHEMIHAFLFVTGNDRDRDGHGPNFQSHMHRINKAAGVNITIYHDFYDEVRLYQTHVWRCNGPCVTRKPYFGIVRKSMNRAPGPSDFWWNTHTRQCGGTFTKIKEPAKQAKKPVAKKPMGDITKYVNNNKATKTNNVTDKTLVFSPIKKPNILVFTGQGHTLVANPSQSIDNVSETVRNVWLNKQNSVVNSTDTKAIEDVAQHVKNIWEKKQLDNNKDKVPKTAKRKSSTVPTPTPPKTKKIDDFFKSKGKALLKDLYGKDLVIPPRKIESQPNIPPEDNGFADRLVHCPICSSKFLITDINRHIDVCLNQAAIDKLSKTEHKIPTTLPLFKDDIERIEIEPPITITKKEPTTTLNIPAFKPRLSKKPEFINSTITVDNLTNFIDKVNHTGAIAAEFQSKVQLCPCCELKIYKPMEEHMEECLAFFSNNATRTEVGASTSAHNIKTIDLDDYEYDALDETLTMNATGTKCPCPVCLTMIEQNDMNEHLDTCLG